MDIAFAILILIHGIAHLVGFVVPWKLVKFEDMPYKTTLLNGSIDAGASGIKIIGILWLITATLFIICCFGILFYWDIDYLVYITATISLIMSILGLPDSKLGIPVNILIFIYLILT